MLEILLNKQEDVPWAALHYLTGEVVYGGRITDYWDRRCLLSILKMFCSPPLLEENFAYTRDGVRRFLFVQCFPTPPVLFLLYVGLLGPYSLSN